MLHPIHGLRGYVASSALRVRNFRLYFFGQALSNIGTWFQMLAQGLLVLRITGSAAALGVATAAQTLPMLFLGAWAGVVIDRTNMRRLIIVTSGLAGLQALVLGVVTATGHVTLLWVVALALLLGFVQIFDRSVGQAFLPQLVDRELLPSGVALNSVMMSTGRLVGPALAGLLFTLQGPAACFFVNACSYAAVVVAMLLLRRSELHAWQPQTRQKGQLREGLRYAWHHPLLRGTLLANALVGCLAFNFPTVYASMVTFVFNAGGAAFGAAESTNAVFAVLGGLVLARRLRAPTMRTFVIACVALGATLTANGLAPTLGVFIACMPFFGVAVVSYQTIGQSLVQQHTPHEMIGRVMSLYVLGTMGTTPIGALLTGAVTDATSARVSLLLGASSLFVSAAVLWFAHHRRPDFSDTAGARAVTLDEEEAVIAETLAET